MGLLTDEMKARKHLEEVVTQLNTEVISKTLNITNNLGQTNLIIADLHAKLQNMEIKLEQSVQQQKNGKCCSSSKCFQPSEGQLDHSAKLFIHSAELYYASTKLFYVTTHGTTYVRWSRKQCPDENNTELVYSGYTGGGSYNDYGAAPEPVCLPLDPDFNKTSGGGGDYAIIHGAEFDSNFFASNSAHQDIPCAVCRVKQASSVIMIPGKNMCYTGWNLEYNGYLATNAYNEHGASSYICIDIQPEYVTGGSSWKHDGKLFYEVVAKCGSLQCPPYHNDYPMTCVVCSK
ncbi:unnamed protein product [Mytilus edulis]|uniref:Short-chain collagen C4-like n=1 Tax=Mytilus edulis TaxID=6550 RepID=A0A8S3RX20_MYTED|nr:unnamed protein product [Mytilus edulis]